MGNLGFPSLINALNSISGNIFIDSVDKFSWNEGRGSNSFPHNLNWSMKLTWLALSNFAICRTMKTIWINVLMNCQKQAEVKGIGWRWPCCNVNKSLLTWMHAWPHIHIIGHAWHLTSSYSTWRLKVNIELTFLTVFLLHTLPLLLWITGSLTVQLVILV